MDKGTIMWKEKRKRWLFVGVGMVLFVTVLCFSLHYLTNQTYADFRVVEEKQELSSANGNYLYFAKGILKYSRDGVAFYSKEGEELWNQPCQMQTPTIATCDSMAVLGDIGGTSVMVLNEEGVRGEFQTGRPIERLTVSAQGIVGAILKAEISPQICCYDAKGNVLVEQKTSLTNTGYPLGLALSKDGKRLLVTYLLTEETEVSTRVLYYSFEDNVSQHELCEATYSGKMVPVGTYLTDSVCVLAGDGMLAFWKGNGKPKETEKATFDREIQTLVCQEEKVALVLKNEDGKGYELQVYNKNGNRLFMESFQESYSHLTICQNQIILYEGSKCLIYNGQGTKRYEGDLKMTIRGLVPVSGWNRYLLLGADGAQEIQLKK